MGGKAVVVGDGESGNVLDEAGLLQIGSIIYNSSEFSDEKKCSISFIEYKDGDEISKLPCGHIFNKESILKWLLKEQAKCPVCRYKLSSKEVKNTDISENPQSFIDMFSDIMIEREIMYDEETLQRAILDSLNI